MKGLLIVDDEEGIRRSVQVALRRENYNISMAETGREAVDLVEKDPSSIAAVISDFKMPGMNGVETLVAIGDLNPEICRIMLTGYATLESAIQATNEGIDGFLTKPFDNNDLRKKVREYMVKKTMKQGVAAETMEEIQAAPESMVPRRQRVSVLYTNIPNFSTVMAENEPEDLCALVSEHYFKPLADIVLSYKGVVDKFLGDSIVALFGAPVAHPDDARQAVFAALDMKERMGLINQELANRGQSQLPFAASIATWEAVVALWGSAHKREYGAQGPAVSIAAALEERAEAGQILIDAATYGAVQEYVQGEPLPPVEVRGVPAALPVYNVVGTLRSMR